MKKTVLILAATLVSASAFAQNAAVSVGLKSYENAPCAAQPKAVYENEAVEVFALVKGLKSNAQVRFFVSRDNFNRRNNEYNFFDSMFDYVQGKEVVSEKRSDGSVLYKAKFSLRELNPVLDYAQITYGVTAWDDANKPVAASGLIQVARKVIFERTLEANLNCYQIYSAKPETSLYVNENDTPQTIAVADTIQKIEQERKGRNSGWSISPSIFANNVGLSLGGFSSTRLREVNKSVSEAMYTSVNNTLDPGDRGFVYSQATRFKDGYKMFTVDYCGVKKFQGPAFFQRWVTNFNLVKVDPFSKNPFSSTPYGVTAVNTCSDVDQVPIIQLPVGRDAKD